MGIPVFRTEEFAFLKIKDFLNLFRFLAVKLLHLADDYPARVRNRVRGAVREKKPDELDVISRGVFEVLNRPHLRFRVEALPRSRRQKNEKKLRKERVPRVYSLTRQRVEVKHSQFYMLHAVDAKPTKVVEPSRFETNGIIQLCRRGNEPHVDVPLDAGGVRTNVRIV